MEYNKKIIAFISLIFKFYKKNMCYFKKRVSDISIINKNKNIQ